MDKLAGCQGNSLNFKMKTYIIFQYLPWGVGGGGVEDWDSLDNYPALVNRLVDQEPVVMIHVRA